MDLGNWKTHRKACTKASADAPSIPLAPAATANEQQARLAKDEAEARVKRVEAQLALADPEEQEALQQKLSQAQLSFQETLATFNEATASASKARGDAWFAPKKAKP